MKKGFTLIELLATLVIIGLISAIVIPAINKTVENNKIDLCNSQLENIVSATLLWKSDNQLYLPTSNSSDKKVSVQDLIDGKENINSEYKTLLLSIGFLKEEGYIEEKCENDICFANVYDATKKEYISEDTVIEITKNNKKYDYKVNYTCENK